MHGKYEFLVKGVNNDDRKKIQFFCGELKGFLFSFVFFNQVNVTQSVKQFNYILNIKLLYYYKSKIFVRTIFLNGDKDNKKRFLVWSRNGEIITNLFFILE